MCPWQLFTIHVCRSLSIIRHLLPRIRIPLPRAPHSPSSLPSPILFFVCLSIVSGLLPLPSTLREIPSLYITHTFSLSLVLSLSRSLARSLSLSLSRARSLSHISGLLPLPSGAFGGSLPRDNVRDRKGMTCGAT